MIFSANVQFKCQGQCDNAYVHIPLFFINQAFSKQLTASDESSQKNVGRTEKVSFHITFYKFPMLFPQTTSIHDEATETRKQFKN